MSDNSGEVSEFMPGLFDPLEVKGLRLKNRIVMPPMANNQATEEGLVTPALIDHYVQRAEGGVALVMVEHSYVVPAGRFNRRQLAITSDAALPGLREPGRGFKGDEGPACFAP
ncbi:MAG: hypothetical protein QJR13_05075, partial [Bacillota bacterium]|nr:hypothetical protein [Bacillota bacterium]